MLATQRQKNLCLKILMKSHPDLHSSILTEVKKGASVESLDRVTELKEVFDEAGLNDKRLFIAIVFRLFHPELYKIDNRDIPLSRGLNLKIAAAIKTDSGNTARIVKEVRTWLRYGIDDLRKRTDDFFDQNFKDV